MRDRSAEFAAVPIIAVLLFLAISMASGSAADQVGQPAPDFRLPDTQGQTHSLLEYTSQGRAVVLEFWSFKCPVSLAYDQRVSALCRKYRDQGVIVLAIASNANESPDAVKKNAESRKLPFPVLLDKDGTVADRLGVTVNPTFFLVNRDSSLSYRGPLDNNMDIGEGGRIAHLEDALEAVLEGRSVATAERKAVGCTLKRKGV